jgi:hypothetical protein
MQIWLGGRLPSGYDLEQELDGFRGRVGQPVTPELQTMSQLSQLCGETFVVLKDWNARDVKWMASDLEICTSVDYRVLTIAMLEAGFEGRPGRFYNSEGCTCWQFKAGLPRSSLKWMDNLFDVYRRVTNGS